MTSLKPHFKSVHPVLPVQDVIVALRFYKKKLGFEIAFADHPKDPKYAGVRRGDAEIHLQWHDSKEWETTTDRPMLRFVIDGIEALFDEYRTKEVFHENTALRKTTWGTREFAFYDPYKNGLTFYCDV